MGGKVAVYIFHGGDPWIVRVRYTIILGGLGVIPQENVYFEHPEIISGAFLDQKLLITNLQHEKSDLLGLCLMQLHCSIHNFKDLKGGEGSARGKCPFPPPPQCTPVYAGMPILSPKLIVQIHCICIQVAKGVLQVSATRGDKFTCNIHSYYIYTVYLCMHGHV